MSKMERRDPCLYSCKECGCNFVAYISEEEGEKLACIRCGNAKLVAAFLHK